MSQTPLWFFLLKRINKHEKEITSIMKCGMKFLIHSQTSMAEPLKFGNGLMISSHSFLGLRLLIHYGIKINAYQ